MKTRLNTQEYVDGITEGDRVILAKAITLSESGLAADKKLADSILEQVLSKTGNSIRIGITGVPGVGKSTFIEAFGKYIIQHQHKKVAVLTVDPSSQLTKGSILGDKTRMEELAKNPKAFIRPSASSDALGGVTNSTREAIHLCEAAGFEIIIVETIGVGQSETAVRKVVDFFLLLMLAGAGDELQGIKKGIMEMADTIAITKADGDNKKKATEAQAEYQHALNLFRQNDSGWTPKVITCSTFANEGIESIWTILDEFIKFHKGNGQFEINRQLQQADWMNECFDALVKSEMSTSHTFSEKKKNLKSMVLNNKKTPQQAAQELLTEFIKSFQK